MGGKHFNPPPPTWNRVKSFIIFVYLSFNTIISHQFFDNQVTLVNQQQEKTNSKGDFVLKNRFKVRYTKINPTQIHVCISETSQNLVKQGQKLSIRT